jgi:hypothetical protein
MPLGRRMASSVARAAVCCALLAAPAFSAEEEPVAANELVVPPGQDDLLAAMLGRGIPLPDGCSFAGGQADGAVIRAAYACPTGAVVFDLVHPTNQVASNVQTASFALTLQSGSPSDAFVVALMSLIHSREGSFHWIPLADEAAAGVARDQADAGE